MVLWKLCKCCLKSYKLKLNAFKNATNNIETVVGELHSNWEVYLTGDMLTFTSAYMCKNYLVVGETHSNFHRMSNAIYCKALCNLPWMHLGTWLDPHINWPQTFSTYRQLFMVVSPHGVKKANKEPLWTDLILFGRSFNKHTLPLFCQFAAHFSTDHPEKFKLLKSYTKVNEFNKRLVYNITNKV